MSVNRPRIDSVDHLCRVLGIGFSAEQVAAITAPLDDPHVIVAGAGSGKTTVMAARVVWLVGHEGVEPGRVLGLTFTKKAAAELGQRVRSSLLAMGDARDVNAMFEELGEPTVSTYNAFAGALITEHGLRLGLETDLHVSSDATRFQRAARVVRHCREPFANIRVQLTATVERVLALDGALSEHLVTPERLREHDRAVVAAIAAVPKLTNDLAKARDAALERIDLSRLVEAYRADKLAAGVMDFSDQMAGGARLGIECPDVGEILRERYGVVLLDEYQDTSVAQRMMLQGLFSGPDAEHGRGHPLTAVGDPAQGIYGWRGASSDNIERFTEHFPCGDGGPARRYSLRVSRRCHPDVLDVANRAAASFYADQPYLEPLLPAEGEHGEAEITADVHETISGEITALVERVRQARESAPDEDIAVLVRTRAEMPTITSALRGVGVDAEVLGLAGLLSLPHVCDVVSLLEVAADATANPSMLRLLTGDRWRIGARDLALLGRRAATLAAELRPEPDESLAGRLSAAVEGSDPTEVVSLSDAVESPGSLEYSPEARQRFAEVAQLVRDVRRAIGSPVADVVLLAVRRLDLDIETALLDTGAADDLARLVEVADDIGGREVDSLAGFLAYLRAEDEFGQGLEVPDRARPGAVQVLTIHAAKGLEWDRVFVPFVVGGSFPSGQGRDRWTSTSSGFPYPLRGDYDVLPHLAEWSNAALGALVGEFREADATEEVRLAYVAFTRARRALHVSGHRWGRTQTKPRASSPFMAAVAEAMKAQGRPIAPWAPEPSPGEVNPELDAPPVAWPAPPPAMPARRHAADLVREALGPGFDPAPVAGLAGLEEQLTLLREERQRAREHVTVPLPASLSATAALDLARDEEAFARRLARPVPRRPSPAARLGTRFHAWVETRLGRHQQQLLDPSDLPGRGDLDLASDAELDEVVELFLAGPYADAEAHAVEVPFSLVLGGQQVLGRIDAVFTTSDGQVELVDWKTNRHADADPLQLAIYRLAWAEMHDLPLDRITGAFYYVRRGEVARYTDLPGRAGIEAALGLGSEVERG